MSRFHAVILGAVLLICLLFAPPAGANPMFRLWVACSDLIFVGTATNTEDSTTDFRFSHVMVDSVLYGPLAAGDTLRVQWFARPHVTEDGMRYPKAIRELDSLHGIPTIYFLRTGEGIRLAEVPPLSLQPDSRSRLESRLSWILSPPEGDTLVRRMEGAIPYPCSAGNLDVAEDKLESLAGCIQAYLRDLDSVQEQ